MDRNSFDRSMERIKAFYPWPMSREDLEGWTSYLSALLEAVSFMSALEWEETCKEVAKVLTSRRPVPAIFLSTHKRLAHERGWIKPKLEDKCLSCSSTGWVMGKYRHRDTHEIIEAARPCPICRRRQYDQWALKPEFESVT